MKKKTVTIKYKSITGKKQKISFKFYNEETLVKELDSQYKNINIKSITIN